MFNLADKISDLPSINDGLQNSKYMQVAPSRDCTLSNFPNGSQYFNFETSGNTWWCPAKTYLRYRIEYTRGDGAPLNPAEPEVGEADLEISPNPMMIANLYQSCEFRIGGQTVGQVGDFLPQVDALKTRMSKSKPWLDSIGELSNFCSANDDLRKSEIMADVPKVNASATSTLVNGEQGREKGKLECIWRPPLNIMDVESCLPSGKYSLVLNPINASQYKLNSVLTGGATSKTAGVGGAFDFKITDIYLYVHTVEGETVSSKSYALDLQNIHCQADTVQNSSLNQRYFDVSPSTVALAVAYQDVRLQDTRVSASYFTCSSAGPVLESFASGKLQNNLNRFFISYAGMQKPAPDADPQYDVTTDRLAERYYETQLESLMAFDPAGPETYQEWLRRGLYMLYNFPKDGDSAATRVQVNSQFSEVTGDAMRVLLFSISRTAAQITVSNGSVVNVTLAER